MPGYGQSMLTLLLATALATPCEPMGSTTFDALLLDAQVAADRGDSVTHQALVDEIERALPCLRFAPPPRRWAELLLQLSLVAFSEGGDWEPPLELALALRPTLDRGVGGAHPMARFEPAERETKRTPVDSPFTVYVDGAQSRTVTDDGLFHLVQVKSERGHWRSHFGADIPPRGFFEQPIPSDSPWRGWLTATLRAGAGYRSQRTSETSGGTQFVPNTAAATSQGGGSVRFGFRYRNDVAVIGLIEPEVSELRSPAGSAAFLGVGRPLGPVTVGLGASVLWVDAIRGCQSDGLVGASYCPRSLALPMGGLALWAPLRRSTWALTAGGGRSALFVDGHAAFSVGSSGLLVGLRAAGALAFIGQAGGTSGTIATVRGGLEVGWGLREGVSRDQPLAEGQ